MFIKGGVLNSFTTPAGGWAGSWLLLGDRLVIADTAKTKKVTPEKVDSV